MKKKYLGIICLLYALIILFVNHYNILRNFLAPSMHIYLKCSVPILLIMGIVILYSEKSTYHFKLIDLALFLPLIMLILAGDGRISTSFASNKTSIIKVNKIKSNKKDDNKKVEIDVSKLDFSNPDIIIEDNNYLALSSYFTYNNKSDDYIGKTIRVRGFTISDNSNLPKGLFGLGKYGVTCCAADAGFMGFILDVDKNKIRSNTWYEVEGYFEKDKDLAGYGIYVIKVVNIKEIDSKNEEEYVYPCYQYEDDCKNVKKYDLKY